MGAATSAVTCAAAVSSQVISVFSVAINIATLGAAGPATNAVKKGSQVTTGVLSKVQPYINKAKELYNTVETKTANFRDVLSKLADAGGKVVTVGVVVKTLAGDVANMSEADALRLGTNIASLFDPTGIASLVAAYSYDLCSKFKS